EDIIVSTETGDEFIIFLTKKREDKSDFYPSDLESLCDRMTDWLNENIPAITFPYFKGRPRVGVGYAIVLHNPLIREEKLVNKLIDDARLMAEYQGFKTMMRDKEKLQELIIKESIITVFHPIVDFVKKKIIGYEALTRGPEGTEYESPYVLFDAASDSELLFELDRLCRQKALLNAKGLSSDYRLFMNCIPSAVHDPEFRGRYLQALLDEVSIRPENVVFEVTEREAIDNYHLFREAVEYYTDFGFSIAVDDAGAGYSSLETIVELKPHYIKLDISIIRGIEKNILKQELIRAIKSLADKMHSTVIAEGIETEAELSALKEIGIQTGQGFLFAKPGPAFPDINRNIIQSA
ncbi:MAG TPA: EAL domain-containing protein, partial [Nitrospirae bacterium]|nr:EAL domain-containing protein [Nitrospirota bacterium]